MEFGSLVDINIFVIILFKFTFLIFCIFIKSLNFKRKRRSFVQRYTLLNFGNCTECTEAVVYFLKLSFYRGSCLKLKEIYVGKKYIDPKCTVHNLHISEFLYMFLVCRLLKQHKNFFVESGFFSIANFFVSFFVKINKK